MTLIACVVALMLICLAALVYGVHLLYRAIEHPLTKDTVARAGIGYYIGSIAFSVAGLIGFILEIILLLSLLQNL